MAEIGLGVLLAKKLTKAKKGEPFPEADDPRVEEARQAQLKAERDRRGRSSTILTGGLGLQDEPVVNRPTLFGG
jgi:hypothetical protein